jgi:hypothetical protein
MLFEEQWLKNDRYTVETEIRFERTQYLYLYKLESGLGCFESNNFSELLGK